MSPRARAGSRPPVLTVEQQHPWLWHLYAATVVATVLVSALLGGCGGSADPVDDGRSTIIPVACPASGACK